MADNYNIRNWYWSVQNASPSTQVWSSVAAAYVSVSDATYLAWVANDNTATVIATENELWGVFREFNRMGWPLNSRVSGPSTFSTTDTISSAWSPFVARSATAPDLTLTQKFIFGALADTTVRWPGACALGQSVSFYNYGSTYAYTLVFFGMTNVIYPGEVIRFTLADDTTANGTWFTTITNGAPLFETYSAAHAALGGL